MLDLFTVTSFSEYFAVFGGIQHCKERWEGTEWRGFQIKGNETRSHKSCYLASFLENVFTPALHPHLSILFSNASPCGKKMVFFPVKHLYLIKEAICHREFFSRWNASTSAMKFVNSASLTVVFVWTSPEGVHQGAPTCFDSEAFLENALGLFVGAGVCHLNFRPSRRPIQVVR